MPVAELQRRQAMRWVATAAVAVAGAGVVVGGVLLSRGAELDGQLNHRVVAALEQAPPGAAAEHGAHPGHGQPVDPDRRVDIDGHELRCAAKVFGHDPQDASAVEDVTVIYAHRMCAAVGPGLAWPASIRETGPVAVRLGVPDTLVLPEKALSQNAAANYADRIRAVVPERCHKEALAYADFVDPEVSEELQDRLDD